MLAAEAKGKPSRSAQNAAEPKGKGMRTHADARGRGDGDDATGQAHNSVPWLGISPRHGQSDDSTRSPPRGQEGVGDDTESSARGLSSDEQEATADRARENGHTRSSIFELSADLAKSLRNSVSDLSAGVDLWAAAPFLSGMPEDAPSSPESRGSPVPCLRGGSSSSSSAGPSGASSTGLFVEEEILHVVRLAFRQLLLEIPEVPAGDGTAVMQALPRFLHSRALTALLDRGLDEDVASTSRGPSNSSLASALASDGSSSDVRPSLLSTVVRSQLIAHVMGCYEAITSELSPWEARLWEAFVGEDLELAGALQAHSEGLYRLLAEASPSPGRAEILALALAERATVAAATEEGEVDFADILDACGEEIPTEPVWSLRTSIRSSFSQLLTSAAGLGLRVGSGGGSFVSWLPQGGSSSRVAKELRSRCARAPLPRLAAGAIAYQRTLVLTRSWQCEQRLFCLTTSPGLLANGRGGSSDGDGRRTQSDSVLDALLSMLRGLLAELAPTERVLWEILGSKDRNFDGALTKSEVDAGLDDLLGYAQALEDASDATEAELAELNRLRGDCRQQSVDDLFSTGRKVATLADVIRWWWDMSEEYRTACGLVLPAEYLRKSVQRQPEEMFRSQLRRVAMEPQAAEIALRGHARVFAELRALALRRAIEGLHSQSPTETRTSTSVNSEAGEKEYEEDDNDDNSDRRKTVRVVSDVSE